MCPEAQLGGPIALVEDGDKISVNSEDMTINWLVDEATVQRRRDGWKQRSLKVNRGILLRYARDVAVSQNLAVQLSEIC